MGFKVKTSEIREAISRIIPFVPAKSIFTAAQNLLIKQSNNIVEFYATDLEVYAKTVLENVEQIDDAKSNICIAIPHKTINDLIKNMEDDDILYFTNVTQQEDNPNSLALTVQSDSGQYNISGIHESAFPSFDLSVQGVEFEMKAYDLLEIIEKTIFAVASDDFRPQLDGVYFHFKPETTNFVASNGFILIKIRRDDLASAHIPSITVPRKALNAIKTTLKKLSKEDTLKITLSKDALYLYHPVLSMKCQSLAQSYPDYERVIPPPSNNMAIIDRNKLISAIRRLKHFADKSSNAISLDFSKHTITLQSYDVLSHHSGVEVIPCEYSGEEMHFKFRIDGLLDVVSAPDTDYIKIYIYDPLKPVLIQPHTDTGTHALDITGLIMPLQT